MLFNNFGRLCTILTDFPGPTISPFFIICIPLLAVHEKSPLIGLTAYVYHNLPIKIPCLVSLIMSSCLLFPGVTIKLCGAETGIGSALFPMGDPILIAFPDDSFSPSL